MSHGEKFFSLMYFYVFVVVESIHISLYTHMSCFVEQRDRGFELGVRQGLFGFRAFAIGGLAGVSRTFAGLGRGECDFIIVVFVVEGQAFVFVLDE